MIVKISHNKCHFYNKQLVIQLCRKDVIISYNNADQWRTVHHKHTLHCVSQPLTHKCNEKKLMFAQFISFVMHLQIALTIDRCYVLTIKIFMPYKHFMPQYFMLLQIN